MDKNGTDINEQSRTTPSFSALGMRIIRDGRPVDPPTAAEAQSRTTPEFAAQGMRIVHPMTQGQPGRGGNGC